MKVRIDRDSLLHTIQAVSKAVATNSVVPILAGIKIEAQDDRLVLWGNDLEMGIKCEVSAQVDENGVVVVPGKTLLEMVKRLPETEICLETDNLNLIITYYFSEVVLSGYDPDEFPVMPEFTGSSLEIPANLFKEMVRKTIIAAANDESRPILHGVLLDWNDGNLGVVATDAHRLAYINTADIPANEETFNVVVPVKAVNEILRLIPTEGNIKLTIKNNKALFIFDKITLFTGLLEGKFPDYKRVIPTSHMSKVIIKRKPFLEAIERASLVIDKPGLKFSFNQGQLEITAQANTGRVREEMSIEQEGEDVDILFNFKYIKEVLKVIDTEEIILEMNGKHGPGVIREPENGHYVYLVLPMRQE